MYRLCKKYLISWISNNNCANFFASYCVIEVTTGVPLLVSCAIENIIFNDFKYSTNYHNECCKIKYNYKYFYFHNILGFRKTGFPNPNPK
jgi:hypothetical protein